VINRVLTRTSSSRVNPRKNRYWFLIIFAGLVIYNLSINLASIRFSTPWISTHIEIHHGVLDTDGRVVAIRKRTSYPQRRPFLSSKRMDTHRASPNRQKKLPQRPNRWSHPRLPLHEAPSHALQLNRHRF
ncbi:unnamed protein product, partial [Brassica rapa subsp. trilocularis]